MDAANDKRGHDMMFTKNKKVNKNAGSTMVETLVSFVVLFIVLAGLYGIVSFSSDTAASAS